MDTKTINLIDAALDDLAAAGLNPIIPKVAGAFAESLASRIYANQTRPAKRDLAELIEDAVDATITTLQGELDNRR